MGWIVPNEKLVTGVSICNSLSIDAFESLLNLSYVNSFGTDEEKQQESLTLDWTEVDKPKLNLAVKTLNYILKRSMNFIHKPETMANDLETLTRMNKDKAEAFVKFWIAKTKDVLDGVNPGRELTEVKWDLQVALSSSAEQRLREPIGVLRLKTTNEDNMNLELNHEELLDFYSSLEEIQDELDFLKEI